MIRPLDLADNISKAPYADRVNQVQRQQPETDQQAFHTQLLEKAAESQSKTQETEKEEKVRNEREKQKNQQEAQDRSGAEHEEADQEHGETNGEVLGKHIDVVV